MQQVSRHLLIVLWIVALGLGLRTELPPQKMPFPTTTILGSFPYQLGPFRGRDIETAEATTARVLYHPARIVLREYFDVSGNRIELFIAPAPFGSKDPLQCLGYRGSVVNYVKESFLAANPPVKVREIVVLSPPQRSDKIWACLYYWRGKRAGCGNEPWVPLLNKIDGLLGREENAFLVQAHTTIRHQTEAELAFVKLRAFASTVDPILAAAVRDSGILAQ